MPCINRPRVVTKKLDIAGCSCELRKMYDCINIENIHEIILNASSEFSIE